MYEVDDVALLAREVLRERLGELIAETCAWAVGLSDQPHLARRHGRLVPTGVTLGMRVDAGLPLGSEEDERLDLGGGRPGTFQDALNAARADGTLHADALDQQVLTPFVLSTCVAAAERARERRPQAWTELLDDLGEEGLDLTEVVRAAEWEAPLKTEAELLVLAALAQVPLVEVEAEGLPLSLVRAAESVTRGAVPQPAPPAGTASDELAGALFLASAALDGAGLPVPVGEPDADVLLAVLLDQGLEPAEVVAVLGHLPVRSETAQRVLSTLSRLGDR